MAKKKSSESKARDWRRAVKEAMRKATLKEAAERYGSRRPVFNYRWEHVKSVVTLALKLAEQTGADLEVVEAAAWLHDVRKEAGSSHPQEGAKYARTLLPKTDFPPQKIEAVAQAIEDHMGLWRDKPFADGPLANLESAVLWDADKLAKIGLTAAFHWLGLSFAKGMVQETEDFIENGRKPDWEAKTVASMHTKPAKQAAKKRLKAYNKLWDKLESELQAKDLA